LFEQIKNGFCGLKAQMFNLAVNPPFCKTFVVRSAIFLRYSTQLMIYDHNFFHQDRLLLLVLSLDILLSFILLFFDIGLSVFSSSVSCSLAISFSEFFGSDKSSYLELSTLVFSSSAFSAFKSAILLRASFFFCSRSISSLLHSLFSFRSEMNFS